MRWHDYWFGVSVQPRVSLDHMPLMEYFLTEEDGWTILPVSAARRLEQSANVTIRELEDPPYRTCYCLREAERNLPAAERFLAEMRRFLTGQEGVEVLT